METELIKKINRYFHDEESRYFSDRHAVRMAEESSFYKTLFGRILKPDGIRIIDIGSGTGLVGSSFPGRNANFVCSDISYNMINKAKENFLKKDKGFFKYTVCDAETLPFKSGSFDVVVCNAAMHHFPSVSSFAAEIKRVLSPGGYIVIGFEANRRFWLNKTLSVLFRAASRLRMVGGKEGGIPYKEVCAAVNRRLIDEGVIKEPIAYSKMLKYVDAHSPNAGEKIDYEEGFDAGELIDSEFKGYEPSVYYHYGTLPAPVRIINRLFFPACAPKFSLVMKRVHQ